MPSEARMRAAVVFTAPIYGRQILYIHSVAPYSRRMADYLDALNPAQRDAVVHGKGPLLIIAGAGSGKTNTLALRAAHLTLGGADARRILLLTFSRRAAAEMSLRAQRILARATAGSGGPIAQ